MRKPNRARQNGSASAAAQQAAPQSGPPRRAPKPSAPDTSLWDLEEHPEGGYCLISPRRKRRRLSLEEAAAFFLEHYIPAALVPALRRTLAASSREQGQGGAGDIAAALDLSADHRMLLEQLARWRGLKVQEYCVLWLETAFTCDGDALHQTLCGSPQARAKARRLVQTLRPIFQRVYGARGEYMAPCFEPESEPATKGARV